MKTITEDGEIIDSNCEDCVVFFKTPYNHDRDAEAARTALYCKDVTLTDQSFKEEADINVIIERLKQGAEIPVTLPEHFGDQSMIPTWLETQNRIAENNKTFYNLDPDVRSEFLNDPARWADHVKKQLQEGNLPELDRMGLDTGNWIVQTRPRPPEAATGGPPVPPETPKETETKK